MKTAEQAWFGSYPMQDWQFCIRMPDRLRCSGFVNSYRRPDASQPDPYASLRGSSLC